MNIDAIMGEALAVDTLMERADAAGKQSVAEHYVRRLHGIGYVEVHICGYGIHECHPGGMSNLLPSTVSDLMDSLNTDQLAVSSAFKASNSMRMATFAMRKGGWLIVATLPHGHREAKSRLRVFRRVLRKLEKLT